MLSKKLTNPTIFSLFIVFTIVCCDNVKSNVDTKSKDNIERRSTTKHKENIKRKNNKYKSTHYGFKGNIKSVKTVDYEAEEKFGELVCGTPYSDSTYYTFNKDSNITMQIEDYYSGKPSNYKKYHYYTDGTIQKIEIFTPKSKTVECYDDHGLLSQSKIYNSKGELNLQSDVIKKKYIWTQILTNADGTKEKYLILYQDWENNAYKKYRLGNNDERILVEERICTQDHSGRNRLFTKMEYSRKTSNTGYDIIYDNNDRIIIKVTSTDNEDGEKIFEKYTYDINGRIISEYHCEESNRNEHSMLVGEEVQLSPLVKSKDNKTDSKDNENNYKECGDGDTIYYTYQGNLLIKDEKKDQNGELKELTKYEYINDKLVKSVTYNHSGAKEKETKYNDNGDKIYVSFYNGYGKMDRYYEYRYNSNNQLIYKKEDGEEHYISYEGNTIKTVIGYREIKYTNIKIETLNEQGLVDSSIICDLTDSRIKRSFNKYKYDDKHNIIEKITDTYFDNDFAQQLQIYDDNDNITTVANFGYYNRLKINPFEIPDLSEIKIDTYIKCDYDDDSNLIREEDIKTGSLIKSIDYTYENGLLVQKNINDPSRPKSTSYKLSFDDMNNIVVKIIAVYDQMSYQYIIRKREIIYY